MSDSQAIAAVTQTLSRLLRSGIQAMDDAALGNFDIKTGPPDRVKPAEAQSAGVLNLFLYQVGINPAWRNMDMPQRSRPGESGQPPLALTLNYLMTAYGPGDDDIVAHRLLGHAMLVLHDHPLIGRGDIQNYADWSDVGEQPDRLRITPQSLSHEELFRLWSTMQTPYRLSVAIQVSVVLIESRRPVRAPLPVLTRGVGDRGLRVQADVLPPFPTLLSAWADAGPEGVSPGGVLHLQGYHLAGTDLAVRLSRPGAQGFLDLTPEPGASAEALTVALPDPSGGWPSTWGAGPYTVSVRLTPPAGTVQSTNALPLLVLPRLAGINPASVKRRPDGIVTLTVACEPKLQPGQKVSLLLGDLEVPAEPVETQEDSLSFTARPPGPGDYYVRLRVDGADSRLVDHSASPPAFDTSARVTVK